MGEDHSGARVAHFRIVEKLGEGGMGLVFRARDERLDSDFALKVIQPELAGDEQTFRARTPYAYPIEGMVRAMADDPSKAQPLLERARRQCLWMTVPLLHLHALSILGSGRRVIPRFRSRCGWAHAKHAGQLANRRYAKARSPRSRGCNAALESLLCGDFSQ